MDTRQLTASSTMKLARDNIRIVLVDDNEDDCKLLRAILTKAGFKQPVTQLSNGSIAFEYFKYKNATGTEIPHIVLLDINMPLISGVHALRLLREASSFRNLPVIIQTGSDDPVKRRELAHLGIFRFLVKQSDCANVVSALDDFIGLYNHQAPETAA